MSAEQLIAEHFSLQDKIKEANKKVAEYLAPYKARLEQIDGELLSLLNSLGGGDKANISTDVGTCYLSHILNVGIDTEGPKYNDQVGRMALLDYCLDNWDEIGAEMLLVQPQKDAVKRYLDEHNGEPPPGLRVGWFTRVNVRRT